MRKLHFPGYNPVQTGPKACKSQLQTKQKQHMSLYIRTVFINPLDKFWMASVIPVTEHDAIIPRFSENNYKWPEFVYIISRHSEDENYEIWILVTVNNVSRKTLCPLFSLAPGLNCLCHCYIDCNREIPVINGTSTERRKKAISSDQCRPL